MPNFFRPSRNPYVESGLAGAGERHAESPEQPETLRELVFGTGGASEKRLPDLRVKRAPTWRGGGMIFAPVETHRAIPKMYEHQCVNGAVYQGAFYHAPELLAHQVRPQSERYLDAAIALANRKAWEALGWLHTAGPMGTDALVEKLGGSRDAFEAVSRLYLLRMISFDAGKLAVSPLGVRALEEFELIEPAG